jgi:transcriptional regulator with PAS, ATPase and Fis domain
MKTKQNQAHQWVDGFPGAVTVCDMDGIILEMNERSKATFAKDGGGELVGKSLMDCHPPAARAKIEAMMASGETNAYTIEKNGKHKLIYQTPWFQDGKRMGLVEISLEIPEKMPHFKRG